MTLSVSAADAPRPQLATSASTHNASRMTFRTLETSFRIRMALSPIRTRPSHLATFAPASEALRTPDRAESSPAPRLAGPCARQAPGQHPLTSHAFPFHGPSPPSAGCAFHRVCFAPRSPHRPPARRPLVGSPTRRENVLRWTLLRCVPEQTSHVRPLRSPRPVPSPPKSMLRPRRWETHRLGKRASAVSPDAPYRRPRPPRRGRASVDTSSACPRKEEKTCRAELAIGLSYL